jgi:hypothetical protein
MVFHMIISCACDLHLELGIKNLMNVNNYANDWIKKSFSLGPITSKFEDFEIFIWFIFSSNSSNEHVVAETEILFLVIP